MNFMLNIPTSPDPLNPDPPIETGQQVVFGPVTASHRGFNRGSIARETVLTYFRIKRELTGRDYYDGLNEMKRRGFRFVCRAHSGHQLAESVAEEFQTPYLLIRTYLMPQPHLRRVAVYAKKTTSDTPETNRNDSTPN